MPTVNDGAGGRRSRYCAWRTPSGWAAAGCDPAFQGVRDALAEVLASGFEVGAALAVYVDGRRVVDLWGGYADAARTRPWQRDTIVNLYSVKTGLVVMSCQRVQYPLL
jgi:CubicO group peptidase (beta-lactamase class C family)